MATLEEYLNKDTLTYKELINALSQIDMSSPDAVNHVVILTLKRLLGTSLTDQMQETVRAAMQTVQNNHYSSFDDIRRDNPELFDATTVDLWNLVQRAAVEKGVSQEEFSSNYLKLVEVVENYCKQLRAANDLTLAANADLRKQIEGLEAANADLRKQIEEGAANDNKKGDNKKTTILSVACGALAVASVVACVVAGVRGGELNRVNDALEAAGYENLAGEFNTNETVEHAIADLTAKLAAKGITYEEFIEAIAPFEAYGVSPEYLVDENGSISTASLENQSLAQIIDDYLEDVAVVSNVSRYVETAYNAANMETPYEAGTVVDAIDALVAKFPETKLASTLTAMKEAYLNAQSDIVNTREALRDSSKRLAQLEGELASANNSANYWKSEYENTKAEYDQYVKDNQSSEELSRQLEEARGQVNDLTQEKNDLQSEFDSYKEQYTHTEQELNDVEQQLAAANQKYEDLVKSSNATEQELEEARNQIKNLEEEKNNIEQQFNAYKAEYTRTEAELNEVEADLAAAQQELKTAQDSLNEYTQKCASYEQKLAEIDGVISAKDAEIDRLEGEIARLEEIVKAFQSSNSQSQTPAQPEQNGSDVGSTTPDENTNPDQGDQGKDDSGLGNMH